MLAERIKQMLTRDDIGINRFNVDGLSMVTVRAGLLLTAENTVPATEDIPGVEQQLSLMIETHIYEHCRDAARAFWMDVMGSVERDPGADRLNVKKKFDALMNSLAFQPKEVKPDGDV